MTSFKIGSRSVGAGAAPLIIAEMSGNHNQSLEVALQIVEAAAKAGAHALKLQTYTADTMTLDLDQGEFFIKDPNSLWAGSSLYDLYQRAHTPWEWHPPIFARARELGMLAFSTVPLRLLTLMGLILALTAMGYGAWVVGEYFVLGIQVPGYATIVVSVMFFSGIQLFSLGLMAEYVGRIYDEVKRRPTYLLKERCGTGLLGAAPQGQGAQ